MNSQGQPFNESSCSTDLIEINAHNQLHLLSPAERRAREESFRQRKKQAEEQERLRIEASEKNNGQK